MSKTIMDEIGLLRKNATNDLSPLIIDSIVNREAIKITNASMDKVVETTGNIVDLTEQIVERLVYLYRLSGYIIFLLTMLTWKVFLQEPLNSLFSSVITWWPKLSEGWQICIATIIMSIPTGIIIAIGTHIVIKRLFGEKTKK